ncbi:MAG: hypothetical protein UH241_04770 [Acutalibacteraceae bacterium]|nr:hypothetical protein [Acutalibacteraceae bacterium]
MKIIFWLLMYYLLKLREHFCYVAISVTIILMNIGFCLLFFNDKQPNILPQSSLISFCLMAIAYLLRKKDVK